MVELHAGQQNVEGQPSFRICLLNISVIETVPSFKLEYSEGVIDASSFGKNLGNVRWHFGHFIIRELNLTRCGQNFSGAWICIPTG
jgi:hypothetical protein